MAQREFAADPHPSFDAACFHAQQCVEKMMKAVLIGHQVLAPKTHDLVALSRLLQASKIDWIWDEAELERLSRGAVEYRYPSESPNRQDAVEALRVCESLYAELLKFMAANE